MALRDIFMWAALGCSVAGIPALLVVHEWDQRNQAAAKPVPASNGSFVRGHFTDLTVPAVIPRRVAPDVLASSTVEEPLRTGTLATDQVGWSDPVMAPVEPGKAPDDVPPAVARSVDEPKGQSQVASLSAPAIPNADLGNTGTESLARGDEPPIDTVQPVQATAATAVLPPGRLPTQAPAREQKLLPKARLAELPPGPTNAPPVARTELPPSRPGAAKAKAQRKAAKPLNLMQWSLP